MKYPVIRFKSLTIALAEIEPFVKDGATLLHGRPLKKFGNMLPREALANLLICMALNHEESSDKWTFTSDPKHGDGILLKPPSMTMPSLRPNE